jgi:hypothetical protein
VRTWRAKDACSNTGSCDQVITVIDNIAPTVTAGSIAACYEHQADAETAALGATTATDNCDPAPTKHVSTVITGCTATITVRAQDACGNVTPVLLAAVYTTRIDDTPPSIGSITATQGVVNVLNCAATNVQGVVVITVDASDNCGLVNGHPAVTLTNGAASDTAVCVATNGTIFTYNWNVTSNTANGTWTATVTASDLCHSVSTTFTLCVNKTQVTGQVQLQGFVGTGTVPLHTRTVHFVATDNMANVLATWDLALSNVSGDTFDYTLTGVPAGTVGISAKTVWNLRSKLAVVLDMNGQASGVNFTSAKQLRGGDIGGPPLFPPGPPDNQVNFSDYSVLGNNFFSFNAVADIDGNGQVDYSDYFILYGNWFTGGDPQ